MANTVYSSRLAGPAVISTAAHTKLFTVPAGKLCVIRDIELWSQEAVFGTVRLGIGTTATTNNRTMVFPSTATSSRELRLVLNAGEDFYGTVAGGDGSNVHITISGYLLNA